MQRDTFGSWSWNMDRPQPSNGILPTIDLSQKQTTVLVNAVSMNQGDYFPKETQLLRINGVSMPGSMPFSIDAEGKSVLSKEWADPIDALYSTILERADQQVVGAAEEVVATESSEETMAEETTIKPDFEA